MLIYFRRAWEVAMIFRDTLHLHSTPTRLKNVCDFSETIKESKSVYVSIRLRVYYD